MECFSLAFLLCCCVGPLTCDVTGQIVDSVAVFGCAGPVPPDVMNIECLLDDTISFDCEKCSYCVESVSFVIGSDTLPSFYRV